MTRTKLVIFYTVAFIVVSLSSLAGCCCVEHC